jgi:hypothetical protein
MNLRDPETESVATFRELLAQSKHSPWMLNVLTDNRRDASQVADRLSTLEPVEMSVTMDTFIPNGQGEKLAVIEEIELIVGPELSENGLHSPPSQTEQIAALRDFSQTLEKYIASEDNTSLSPAAGKLHSALERLLARLRAQDSAKRDRTLSKLEHSLLGTLPARLQSLITSLETDRVTKSDLPEELVAHWVSKDGLYRIAVFPEKDLNDSSAMRSFVAAVRHVAPNAIGFPVIYLEAGDAVVEAFQQACLLSLLAIAVLLLILLRPKSDALLVLLPLLLAGALTGAASVIADIPFNFANIIALPLLLGIGVDSGIHMVHRMRAAPPSDGQMLQTSTARGVLYSSLTTVCSFGNLAVSPHRGMASMGVLLTIGIGLPFVCTLVVNEQYNTPRAVLVCNI